MEKILIKFNKQILRISTTRIMKLIVSFGFILLIGSAFSSDCASECPVGKQCLQINSAANVPDIYKTVVELLKGKLGICVDKDACQKAIEGYNKQTGNNNIFMCGANSVWNNIIVLLSSVSVAVLYSRM